MRPGFQVVFSFAPSGVQLFLQCVKDFAMVRFLQVAQLVCNHVVDALRGRLDQLRVKGDHTLG